MVNHMREPIFARWFACCRSLRWQQDGDKGPLTVERRRTQLEQSVARYLAQNLIGESGRSLRQGGFRVSSRGKCLSSSGRRETYIPFYERRKRTEAAPLLDQCLPELRAQKPLHAKPAAAHHALGARGCTRGGAEAARRKSARYAHAA